MNIFTDYWSENQLTGEEGHEYDTINPSHYKQGDVECIDAIKAATGDGFTGYLTGNVLKYVWRWKLKNGIEDLRKALWYLERLIGELDDAGR